MGDSRSFREVARQCRALMKQAADPDMVYQLQQWAMECDGKADGLLDSKDLLEQARRHRTRAEEYSAVAEQMEFPKTRASYRSLAETYRALAGDLKPGSPTKIRPAERLRGVGVSPSRCLSRRNTKLPLNKRSHTPPPYLRKIRSISCDCTSAPVTVMTGGRRLAWWDNQKRLCWRWRGSTGW